MIVKVFSIYLVHSVKSWDYNSKGLQVLGSLELSETETEHERQIQRDREREGRCPELCSVIKTIIGLTINPAG